MYFDQQVSVPQEALQSFWMGDRGKTWGVKLNASSSSEQLLQVSFFSSYYMVSSDTNSHQ